MAVGKLIVLEGTDGAGKSTQLEFIKNTQIARSLIFKHPLNQGRLKFLRMDFNQPGPNPSFFTAFLKNYEKKTWEEIQVLFK